MAEPAERSRRSAEREPRREARPDRAERERRDRLYARGGYAGAYDFELEDPSLADDLLDDLIPRDIDWRRLVRRHPWPALVVAGVAGYLLGRSQGRALLGALTGLAVARVEDRVLGMLDEDPDE